MTPLLTLHSAEISRLFFPGALERVDRRSVYALCVIPEFMLVELAMDDPVEIDTRIRAENVPDLWID